MTSPPTGSRQRRYQGPHGPRYPKRIGSGLSAALASIRRWAAMVAQQVVGVQAPGSAAQSPILVNRRTGRKRTSEPDMAISTIKDRVKSEKQRRAILRRIAYREQKGLCFWCGRQMVWKTKENGAETWNHPRSCTADHVLWRSRGGQTTRDNIVAACLECNTRRHPPEPQSPTKLECDWPWLEQLIAPRVRVGHGRPR